MARPAGSIPTIKHVAELAGVSIGTVSRVINGHKDVDPDLRARVESAMRELRYRPNVRAQSFVRDRSPIIAFLVCNWSGLNPAHPLILQGVEERCSEGGYYVLFARYRYPAGAAPSELQLPSVITSRGLADTVIAVGANYDNFLAALDELGLNRVVLGNNLASTKERQFVNQVRYDDCGGYRQAVDYLVQLGHRHIWYIGDGSQPWTPGRCGAYRQQMNAHGLEPRIQTAALSDDPFENGHAAVSLIIERRLPLTAVLADSDDLAQGIQDGLRQHGRDVPRDVNLIGFDYHALSPRARRITSICVDAVEVGRQLAKVALARAESGVDTPEIVVPATLVKRGTCRPCGLEQKSFL